MHYDHCAYFSEVARSRRFIILVGHNWLGARYFSSPSFHQWENPQGLLKLAQSTCMHTLIFIRNCVSTASRIVSKIDCLGDSTHAELEASLTLRFMSIDFLFQIKCTDSEPGAIISADSA